MNNEEQERTGLDFNLDEFQEEEIIVPEKVKEISASTAKVNELERTIQKPRPPKHLSLNKRLLTGRSTQLSLKAHPNAITEMYAIYSEEKLKDSNWSMGLTLELLLDSHRKIKTKDTL